MKISRSGIPGICLFLGICLSPFSAFAQQKPIARIEKMPNLPSPYLMRDWKQVAIGYDSLVFNFNAAGQYLPLIFWNTSPVNYPGHVSFGLHSYVGTIHTGVGEGINVLPAVVGATLAGIDKSNQNGVDWVLMCEEFFNRRPEENVYLNLPVARSGDDWWYDTMPNIFFYQLYDLYPATGDFEYQFTTVADRWLEALNRMGGDITPWKAPYMNYRAWRLSTMTPNDAGVREPEAAGAIAWLLYHAYRETGQSRYRIGAEWAMEFLSRQITNPSYELQLPYGAYVAAKMNAELRTNYDVEKLLNWCFEVGSLRLWGAIVGNWGGYDCHGLIGEASGEGEYAFAMNGFEQVGALVPLVRYDDRFARAIGKWVLNVANASRLFYSKYLPAQNQDSENWTVVHDPHSYIAYEGLRREEFGSSPYATGDAIRGGWAATNLGLYGASHVGILGGIIDTTNVKMILRLDARKTDYFSDDAYPTYLYFNPYPDDRTVTIEVGDGVHDVYDAVSNTFLLSSVSGAADLTLPGDEALLAVITPAGGKVVYDLGRLLVDGIVVDYHSAQAVDNYPPRIKSLAGDRERVFINQTISLYCTAEDREGHLLTYHWDAGGGMFSGTGGVVQWTAPEVAGDYDIECLVSDENGGTAADTITIEVTDNLAPVISSLTAMPAIINIDETSRLTCTAFDPNGDTLTYQWFAPHGSVSDSGAVAYWTAPGNPGYYRVICRVEDSRGAAVQDSVGIVVGGLVGHYPFNNDARDDSGFENHGIVSGATPVADRFGNPNSAYRFDGIDDHIRIPRHPSLNFREAISVNFWMTVSEFPGREAFPISHGSWQNRWKVSLIPERRLRWTVNTTGGISDLDTPTPILADSLYNVTVTYGNGSLKIYLNAEQVASKTWSGLLSQTTLDITIGQMLPGNTQYNFAGIIDDVYIFNYELSEQEIQALNNATGIPQESPSRVPRSTALDQNYPNPFNPTTTIHYTLGRSGPVKLTIFNLLGQKVRDLLNKPQTAGDWRVSWNSRDNQGNPVASGIYIYELRAGEVVLRRKMVLLR